MPKKTIIRKTSPAPQGRYAKLTPVRFAPLFIDWTFKRVFGSKNGVPLLMALLNDFLARVLPAAIKNIKYLPTEFPGETPKSKKVIFDILCEDSAGNFYLLEMQNAKLKNAGGRFRIYLARLQSESIDKGVKDYRVPSSFFIGFLNYKRDESKFYFTEECWFNLQIREIANKKEFRIFVELPKFGKQASMCRSFRDKIIFLFKNLHLIDKRPPNFNEKIFDWLFEVAEISKLKGEELKAFRYSMRYVDERQLAIDCAVEEATEAAIVQGIRQGMKRGFERGAKRSLAKVARNMLKDGLSLARVARITKLPKEQIIALR